uniref:Immunoglobulin like and fibronectin type III domain containing 1, tandem duplicate 2 n=1 Tax=Hucho hucho TaxID=62062 RepID=A0A4W5MMJ7_9TELE
QEKKTISFSCKVNRPDITVKWMKAGQEITMSKRILYRVEKDKHTLTIKDCVMDDEGEYTVMAGDDKCTAELILNEAPTDFSTPLKDQTITEFEDAEFSCKLSKEKAVVKWYRNGREIREGPRPRDQGEYRVVAKEKDARAKLELAAVPKIKTTDQNLVTDAGKPFVMAIPYDAYPRAEAEWFFNIVSLPVQNIDTSADKTEYRLKSPKKTDQGRYKIVIKNKHGQGEAFINLDVIVDVKLIEGLIVKAGSTIVLPAVMKGIPTPTAKWVSDGKELATKANVKIDTEGMNTSLTITGCVRGDTGEYLLTVANPAGSKTVALHVTVLDVPGAPIGPINILEVTPDHMVINWRPPKDDGGTPLTCYIVEKKDTKKAWEPWSVVCSGCTGTKAKISRLEKGREYILRVRAENKVGIGAGLESPPTIAKHMFDPPGPPGQPTCSDITENAVTIEWTLPEFDGGSPVSGYVVERREMTGKWIRVNKTPVLDLRYRASGLFENNSYEFRIFAENVAGVSEPSPVSDPVKCTRPITKPGPPLNPKLRDWSKSYADLVWTKPTRDGGSPILGYIVECQKSASAKWEKVHKDLIPMCAFRAMGLTEGMEYRFRISASNIIGDGKPTELSETLGRRQCLSMSEYWVSSVFSLISELLHFSIAAWSLNICP